MPRRSSNRGLRDREGKGAHGGNRPFPPCQRRQRAQVRILPGAFSRAIVLASLAPVAAISYPARADLLIKEARDRQRRRHTLLVVAVVVGAAVGMIVWGPSGWRSGGAAGTGSGEHLARFSYDGLSFSYPARWTPQNKGAGLSMEGSFVIALSPQHLRSSCRYSGNTGTCGANLMLNHLRPGGVFLAWSEGGPVSTPSSVLAEPGTTVEVGGQAARLDIEHRASRGSACPPETTTSVTVATVNRYQLLACTRGNDARFESDVLAMLRSVAFSSPAADPAPTAFRTRWVGVSPLSRPPGTH